jgi:23S rRNA (pseudouridine1915-N3)-methyltransferase
MRLHVIAVGRLKRGPAEELFELYRRRLTWPLEVREVDEARNLPTAQRVARETELLLAAIPERATVVALDERGQALGSEAFARRVAAWRDGGASDLAFLIGGADGLGDATRTRADLVLSLGPMTWPHQLCRAMLAEQIYRAQSILAGHPYHRA